MGGSRTASYAQKGDLARTLVVTWKLVVTWVRLTKWQGCCVVWAPRATRKIMGPPNAPVGGVACSIARSALCRLGVRMLVLRTAEEGRRSAVSAQGRRVPEGPAVRAWAAGTGGRAASGAWGRRGCQGHVQAQATPTGWGSVGKVLQGRLLRSSRCWQRVHSGAEEAVGCGVVGDMCANMCYGTGLRLVCCCCWWCIGCGARATAASRGRTHGMPCGWAR